MKRFLALLTLFLFPALSHADPICTDWGTLNVCVPFTTVDASFGYAWLTDQGTKEQTTEKQLLLDTKLASIKDVALIFGGSKGAHFAAAPFLGLDYRLPNPVVITPGSGPVAQFLASLRPGVYVGNSDLHKDGWFYGFKTSKTLW